MMILRFSFHFCEESKSSVSLFFFPFPFLILHKAQCFFIDVLFGMVKVQGFFSLTFCLGFGGVGFGRAWLIWVTAAPRILALDTFEIIGCVYSICFGMLQI